jgi:hypothetical protein
VLCFLFGFNEKRRFGLVHFSPFGLISKPTNGEVIIYNLFAIKGFNKVNIKLIMGRILIREGLMIQNLNRREI